MGDTSFLQILDEVISVQGCRQDRMGPFQHQSAASERRSGVRPPDDSQGPGGKPQEMAIHRTANELYGSVMGERGRESQHLLRRQSRLDGQSNQKRLEEIVASEKERVRLKLLQQTLAAFENIAPGGLEIASVPGVSHIADTVCEV